MNKKIIIIVSILSLAPIFTLSSMAFAKATTSSHAITMQVSKVLLLDIDGDNTSTLNLIPNISDNSFQGWKIQNNQPQKMLATSNITAAKLYIKSNFPFEKQNLKLKVRLDNDSNKKSYEKELSDASEVKLADIGMIVTGTNRSTSPLKLSYSASKYGSSKMPTSETHYANLTYTLRDN